MTRKANPVLEGGVVRGTWTRRGDEVTVAWLDDRPRPDAAIAREVERLAGILGRGRHRDLGGRTSTEAVRG